MYHLKVKRINKVIKKENCRFFYNFQHFGVIAQFLCSFLEMKWIKEKENENQYYICYEFSLLLCAVLTLILGRELF